MADPRVVTADDIRLVHESMFRSETGQLRRVGYGAEIIGWIAVFGAILAAGAQWEQLGDYTDFDGSTMPDWRVFVQSILPIFLNLATGGAILVILGRGARLFALHLAGRRGMNFTGIQVGEPLDLDGEDTSLPDEPWRTKDD